MLQRTLYKSLSEKLFKGKTILLIGPRQVGKTTLIHQILEQKEYLFLNGDDPMARTLLTNPSTKEIEGIIGKQKILFIDEAHREYWSHSKDHS